MNAPQYTSKLCLTVFEILMRVEKDFFVSKYLNFRTIKIVNWNIAKFIIFKMLVCVIQFYRNQFLNLFKKKIKYFGKLKLKTILAFSKKVKLWTKAMIWLSYVTTYFCVCFSLLWCIYSLFETDNQNMDELLVFLHL